MYMKNFGEFVSNQIEYAGTVILSRTDTPKATDDKVQAAVELIRSLNQTAAVITTPVEQLSGAKILDIMENNRSLEKELMEEETCRYAADTTTTIITMTTSMSIIITTTMRSVAAAMTTSIIITMTMKNAVAAMTHHHGHHHADEVFTSWGRETVKSFSREEIEQILNTLSTDESYGMILRAKGMVSSETENGFTLTWFRARQYSYRFPGLYRKTVCHRL